MCARVLAKGALVQVNLASLTNEAQRAVARRLLSGGIVGVVDADTTVHAGLTSKIAKNATINDGALRSRISGRALTTGSEVATTLVEVETSSTGIDAVAGVAVARGWDFTGVTSPGTAEGRRAIAAHSRLTAGGSSASSTIEARVLRVNSVSASGGQGAAINPCEAAVTRASPSTFREWNCGVDGAGSSSAATRAGVARIGFARTKALCSSLSNRAAGRRGRSSTGACGSIKVGAVVDTRLANGIGDFAGSHEMITSEPRGHCGLEGGQPAGSQGLLGSIITGCTRFGANLCAGLARGTAEGGLRGAGRALVQHKLSCRIEESTSIGVTLLDQKLELHSTSSRRRGTPPED